jgi:hypothetical protein
MYHRVLHHAFRPQVGNHRIQHRNLNMIALPGFLAGVERRCHRLRGEHGGSLSHMIVRIICGRFVTGCDWISAKPDSARKIAHRLKRDGQTVPVPSTVHQILCRNDRIKPSENAPPNRP